MEDSEFWKFLSSRKGKLDGVCITGGEPLLQPDLETFIRKIRDLGFSIKLDTNGSMPHLLKDLVGKGLVDYVAMDIKNCPERYGETIGIPEFSLEKIQESVTFLLSGTVAFEFRTTIVEEFHTEEDMERLGKWIKGHEPYYLQSFTDSGDVITRGFHAVSAEKRKLFKKIVSAYIPLTQWRGV
jgi:pyruvate formate lyase activating enzyme